MDALHIAVSEGYEDIVKLLLEMGANVSMQLTESGWTPLHLAAQHGRVDIARALLDAGANVLQEENTGLELPPYCSILRARQCDQVASRALCEGK